MANPVPLFFRAAPLPTNFRGTPQQFLDALVERLEAESEIEIAVFVSGSIEPSSNVGPWLKNGVEWYVWDTGTGKYVPQPLEYVSLKYVAGVAEPDHAVYTFWIKLDNTGKATAIMYYSGDAWKDVYEDKFALYYTKAEIDALTASLVTSLSTKYPARATLLTDQNVPASGVVTKLNFNSVVFDPNSAYNVANSRYIAPVKGYYRVSAELQVDNVDADLATMELLLVVTRNGGANALDAGASVASPPGNRWYPIAPGTIALDKDDYLEVGLRATTVPGTGNVKVAQTASTFCVELIQPGT